MPTLRQLQHEYDKTRGLWCIDRNPLEVDYEWIKQNAFQLKDYLKGGGGAEEPDTKGITIGAFSLKPGTMPGKVWMTSPSGAGAELDEKVLEDVLKSFF
jgi:hypothetical protein